jgi:hypothetical protein
LAFPLQNGLVEGMVVILAGKEGNPKKTTELVEVNIEVRPVRKGQFQPIRKAANKELHRFFSLIYGLYCSLVQAIKRYIKENWYILAYSHNIVKEAG